MPICVLFLIWLRDPLYYQISLFLSIFLDFWSWYEGVIHTFKMLKNTSLLKIYPKATKKLKFTSICSDDHGGFCHPFRPLWAVTLMKKCLKRIGHKGVRNWLLLLPRAELTKIISFLRQVKPNVIKAFVCALEHIEKDFLIKRPEKIGSFPVPF